MSIKIKPLEAFHGDSILLSFDENGITRNILTEVLQCKNTNLFI